MEPGPNLEDAYRAAFESALLTRLPPAGHINADGADRLELLHRLGTNSMADLTPASWRFSLLTNSLGRMVDRIQVLELGDSARIITSPGRADSVQGWLQGYIFFQDDVQLTILPGGIQRFIVLGPKADELLSDIFPQAVRLEPRGFSAQAESLIVKIDQPLPGFEIHLADASHELDPQVLDLGYNQASAEVAFQALRIERGLPAAGSEINEDIIPLEIGLAAEIDFVKGCYIGQEVIARMESRGQLAKRLVGLRLPDQLHPGHELLVEGRRVGQLTSVAYSPASGWVGLGLLSRRALGGSHGSLRLDDPDMEIAWQEHPLEAGGDPQA